MATRWDGDERGQGVGDATQLVPGVSELVTAFRQPNWVAEQPEAHLLPHIEDWCQRDGRLALIGADVDGTHAYVVELGWNGATAGVGEVRAAVFSLVGSFAEGATYVRQRRVAGDHGFRLRFEVGTGELAPETRFDSHGHVVVITVGFTP